MTPRSSKRCASRARHWHQGSVSISAGLTRSSHLATRGMAYRLREDCGTRRHRRTPKPVGWIWPKSRSSGDASGADITELARDACFDARRIQPDLAEMHLFVETADQKLLEQVPGCAERPRRYRITWSAGTLDWQRSALEVLGPERNLTIEVDDPRETGRRRAA